MQHELEPICLQMQAEFPNASESFVRRIVGQVMAGCGGRVEDVRHRIANKWDSRGFWNKVEGEIFAREIAQRNALIAMIPIEFVGSHIPEPRRKASICRSVRADLRKHYHLQAGQGVQVTVFESGRWNMKLVDRLHRIGSLEYQYRLMTENEQAWRAFVERNFTYKEVKPLHVGHTFVALTPEGLKNYYANYDPEVFDAWLEEQT